MTDEELLPNGMTRSAFEARRAAVHQETLMPADSAFWLSFVDPELAVGSQFLGACFVEAMSMPDAITASHVLGINPGGAVASIPIPPDIAADVPLKWRHRLLSRDEVNAFDAEMLGE